MCNSTKPIDRVLAAINLVVPESERSKLMGSFQPYKLRKGRVLLGEGEVSSKIYFIEKGVIRAYYTRGSEDVTSLFVSDGEVVCVAASFFRQEPSMEILETLEECIVYSLTYDSYRKLVQYDHKLALLAVELLENQLANFSETIKLLKHFSVEQRINQYLRSPSTVFRRIPDHYVATYLGTTGATFSRVLKNVDY